MTAQDPTTTIDLQQALGELHGIEDEMNEAIVEGATFVREVIIAVAALTHIQAVGEGGIGKSFAIDVFHTHMADDIGKFYILCDKTTDLQEIIGHLSPKRLMEFDEWAYNTTGMLPRARLGVLDEGKKLNSICANGMLRIVNERLMKAPGGQEEECALWTLLLTSNLDEFRVDGATQAWDDRFGSRLVIEAVTSPDGRRKILDGQLARHEAGTRLPTPKTMISCAEVEAIQRAVLGVEFPDDVRAAKVELEQSAATAGLSPSPRRTFEAVKRMKALAFYEGRTRVERQDLVLMRHTLWTDPKDRQLATELVSPYGGQALGLAFDLRTKLTAAQQTLADIESKVDPSTGVPSDEQYGQMSKVQGAITRMVREIEAAEVTASANGSDMTELLSVKRDAMLTRQALRRQLDLD